MKKVPWIALGFAFLWAWAATKSWDEDEQKYRTRLKMYDDLVADMWPLLTTEDRETLLNRIQSDQEFLRIVENKGVSA